MVEVPEPDPLEPELEPLPIPLLEPELGGVVVLGAVGLAGEVLLELPPVAPEELDLLKWASHSEREICPSLFESTDEKVGVEALELALLPPEAAPPLEDDVPDDMPDEPLEPLPDAAGAELLPEAGAELLPDAAGDDEDLSLLVLLEELCARATLESANSAAAVAALNTLRFNIG